jgi:hypothetical protein
MRIPIVLFGLVLIAGGLAAPCAAQAPQPRASGAAAPIGSPEVQTGTVTLVDSVSMNFICRNGTTSRRYWETRATRFVSSRTGGTLFNLAPGQPVRVTSHLSGRDYVADEVTLLR